MDKNSSLKLELPQKININSIIPWVIACALFMETLDITIISTAIPSMAKSFNMNPISLKLAMTSYLISLAVFIPISGWLADKYGAKKIFIYAFFIFTFSSLLCGFSKNLFELIFFRIVQGFGGAIMMPVGRLILLKVYPKEDLVKITNYVTTPALFGPMMGPVVGGLLTTYASWHWIFLVNFPIGLLGVFLAKKYIPFIPLPSIHKFNFKGFIFFGIGLSCLSFLMGTVDESSISVDVRFILLGTSIFSLVFYAVNHRIFGSKLLDFSVFKIRTFKVTVIGSLLSRIGIGGIPFLLPLLFQLGFLFSPLVSGLLLFPMAVGMFVMKFFIRPTLKLLGFKKCLIFNTFFLGVSILSFSLLNQQSNYYLIVFLVFINGLFSSMQFTCMNVLIYVDLDAAILSQGTSIASSIQQLSMSFGVAFSAICLKYFLYILNITEFHIRAFSYSFILIGIFTALTSIIFMFLKNNDGSKSSGKIRVK